MRLWKLAPVFAWLTVLLVLCSCSESQTQPAPSAEDHKDAQEEKAMLVHYLEIVTPEVDATCSALEGMHGVSFGTPVPGLGNARTAALKSGGRIGVRAPMREDEQPVVRPYLLTEDIEAALEAAQAAGAKIAMPPMEAPGQKGRFALYIHGGIEHGLWQL